MKKSLLLAFTALTLFASAQAQDVKQDVKGKTFVNAGIGIGTYGFLGTGGLPVNFSVEHGLTDKITIGPMIGLVQRKFQNDWRYRYFIIGACGSYHFNELLNVAEPKLDVYGGAGLFYRGYSLKYKGHDGETGQTYKNNGGSLDIALHIGGRYMVAEKVGAFAELGYGVSPLQLGVTVQF